MDDINAWVPPGSPWVPRPQALPGRMVPQSPAKNRGRRSSKLWTPTVVREQIRDYHGTNRISMDIESNSWEDFLGYIYIYIVGNTVDNGIRMGCSQSTNWWIMSSVCRDQAKSLLRSMAESTGIILRCEMTWLTNLWQGCHQLIHQSINRTDVGWGWDSPNPSWIVTIPIPFRNHEAANDHLSYIPIFTA